ncbi:MAG: transglycosylase domain-containing protein [Thermodesulfobacteriota bacterium]
MAKSRTKYRNTYVGKRPGRFRFIKAFLWVVSAVALCLIALLATLYYQVSQESATNIQRGVIQSIIFSESPVYYDDGKTPVGVFFEKTHRRYIEYDDIPKTFVKAIVAAEDQGFFNHLGFDSKAIIRAFIANLRAGRVVQGGSTITQQTAKNVFKREKRSYRAKLKEFFQAVLLERKYSKEEILELYVNQFFVSGFGRGLQIAARYFFDKDARELDLVESAFIAGMVKAPNRYNPFTKRSEAERLRATEAGKARKDYVLRKMLELRFIAPDRFREAKALPVPFKEGQVTFRLNVILDYVREQLQSPFFQEILSREGIENIATSGIRVYTSINREIQEGALRSLQQNLPRIDIRLRGYPVAELQEDYQNIRLSLPRRQDTTLPFLGRITHIDQGPDSPSLVVAWENGGGVIDIEGMRDVGEAWVQSRRGIWAEFGERDIPAFMQIFREGDLVPVCMSEPPENGEMIRTLRLTQIPALEGGVIVLQRGMVRAMAGGYFNQFFNRAVDAKRQLGSAFKPFVYTAALQLKWNSLDMLVNVPELYKYQKTVYVPKPDHKPPSGEVSMAWAGVKSENLATVWLLYHLTDHLNLSEFREVVRRVGLHREENEPYEDYVRRIRDDHGVLVDGDALMEAAFQEARKAIESDLIFSGYDAALDTLRHLHFKVGEEGLDLGDINHRRIYRHGYERLRVFNQDMKSAVERIRSALERDPGGPLPPDLKWFRLGRDLLGRSRTVFLGPRLMGDSKDLRSVTPQDLRDQPGLLQAGRVWVDDLLPSSVLDLLEAQTRKNYRKLVEMKRYELDVLARIKDFRVLVNLYYVRELSRQMGISTPLDPVLSFPLGANAVSIAEASRAYQAMMTGKVYLLDENPSERMIPIIQRIEDREGQVIWEYTPRPTRILSERVSGMMAEILRMAVQQGTGRRANDAIRLSVEVDEDRVELPVPGFGKTGTANEYTNSSFMGFLPGPEDEAGGLGLDSGFAVSAYVGYDDNRPMEGERITIYGASGALPVWIDTCNALVNSRTYRKNLQIADLAFDIKPASMTRHADLRPVRISGKTGLPMRFQDDGDPKNSVLILSDVSVEDGAIRVNRNFEPLQ